MTYKVLIVNHDAFELATLSGALRLNTINIIGEAKNLEVAETLFRSLQPAVLIVDLQSNCKEALLLLRKFRKLKPDLGIVFTMTSPDLRLLTINLQDVPTGTQLLVKRFINNVEVIATSIRRSVDLAISGGPMMWVDSRGDLHAKPFDSILNDMTDTQIETFRLLSSGLSNAEIGRVRYVSEKSVEQIVARIAGHFQIAPERSRNLRVLIAGQYFKWIDTAKK